MNNLKVSKALVEHYLIALLVAGTAIWQTGEHSFKKLAWAAAVAVFGPVFHSVYEHLKATNSAK